MITRMHKCGHVQKVCNRCLSVGCNNTNCSECVGKGNDRICKVCECDDVSFMEDRQYRIKSRALEEAKDKQKTENRLRAMENRNRIDMSRPRQIDYAPSPSYGSNSRSSFIPILIMFVVCYGLSQFLKDADVDGPLSLLVAIILIIGGIAEITIQLLVGLVKIIIASV